MTAHDISVTDAVLHVDDLPLSMLDAPRRGMRRLRDIDDLSRSIATVGLLSPLVVCLRADGRYTVVCGVRRLQALTELGWPAVPCHIVRSLDPSQLTAMALADNVAARSLDPIDEAQGYDALIKAGWSQQRIAEAVGVSQSHVSRLWALLRLTPIDQERVRTGSLSINEAYHSLLKHQNAPGKQVKPRKLGGRRLTPGSPRETETVADAERRQEEPREFSDGRPLTGITDVSKRYVALPPDVYAMAQTKSRRAGIPVTAWICRLVKGAS